MSEFKKKIGLIATEISFTQFSIVYKVELDCLDSEMPVFKEAPVLCSPIDIVDKDLILKPTMISSENMFVVYTPSNMIPHYFQSLLDESLSNYEEHKVDIANYYNIGEVVGYIQL